MAEPVKIKLDYQNPENVEAEVPGAQKIREAPPESETDEINDEIQSSSTENNGETSKVNAQNGRVNPEEESSEVITRHSRKHVFSGKRIGIHGEPVMLDKLVDKKPKTKIPVSRFRQTVEKVKEERRNARKEHESHIPIRRSSIPKPVKETKSSSATVKKEITVTKSLTKNHLAEPTVTDTVITKETIEQTAPKSDTTITQIETNSDKNEPEDEFDKIYAEIATDTPSEIVIDDTLMDSKVDPEKLESKFEEIVHDYDEHKLEPIDPDLVRKSRLPVLKRKSQQEIELSAQADRTSKIIAARDKLRLRYSMNKDENFEEALDKELQKEQENNIIFYSNSEKERSNADTKTEIETKHEVITSPSSKTEIKNQVTKTVSTSSSHEQENINSSTNTETTKIREIFTHETNEKKFNTPHHTTEENIITGSIKIGMPVFDSYIHEYSETNAVAKTTEVKSVLSYQSKAEELSITNNILETKNETNILDSKTVTTKEFDIKTETSVSEFVNNLETKIGIADSKLLHTENIRGDLSKSENAEYFKSFDTNSANVQKYVTGKRTTKKDDAQLRRKAERDTFKIDSREVIEIEGNQRESINELRKKKSVMSKIAMFERKPEETVCTRAAKKENRVITRDRQRVENIHIHTPLIVDEVFKPFNADISLNDTVIKDETATENDKTIIAKAEYVTVKSSDSVHYAVNEVKTETKQFQEILTDVITSQGNRETVNNKAIEINTTEANVKSEVAVQKVENAVEEMKEEVSTNKPNTIDEIMTQKSKESKFECNNLEKSPLTLKISRDVSKASDAPLSVNSTFKLDFSEARNKNLSPTRLSMAKELQSPVVIPGFKPVSELLRSFESKQETNNHFANRSISKVEHQTVIETLKFPEIAKIITTESHGITTQISQTDVYNSKHNDDFSTAHDYKSLDDVFSKDTDITKLKSRQEEDLKRGKSLAELDLGDAVKGKVNDMILRMKSVDRTEVERRETINKKELPRKRSVSEKIALFEGKVTPSSEATHTLRIFKSVGIAPELKTAQNTHHKTVQITKTEISKHTTKIERENNVTDINENNVVEEPRNIENDLEVIQQKIEELKSAKVKYGKVEDIPYIELSKGITMPTIAIGTALLDPRLTFHIITAAIDLGYRAIDTAFIYGNEKQVGEAIRTKLDDGTVKREELFIISKLWSTYHRTDLVEGACKASLDAMGLDYFDLYLIHNPMSFKEGGAAIPKIATVIQYSTHDYLDAWYGMEQLVPKGLTRAIGVSNFNSGQLQRVLDKGRIKPVVNQVECHPYLSQQRLDQFCSERNVTLSCFGVLGSKGTPLELKNGQPAVIDDALVQVMASGLGITPAQLLISYQLENGHGVIVKASSAHHLHDNLLATNVHLTTGQVDALHALNRNKRMFTFKGMGDTHKNYPFNAAF